VTAASPPAPDAELVRRLAGEVAERLGVANGAAADPVARQALAASVLNERLDDLASRRIAQGGKPLGTEEEDALAAAVRARLFGVAEFEDLLRDDSVENVICDRWDVIWRRHADGSWEQVAPICDSEEALTEIIRTAAATSGRAERRFDAGRPWVSFRLADGSRLTAVRPEIAGRTAFAIRRHRYAHADIATLRRLGTLSACVASLLAAAVLARLNILITGSTDAGKTTLLRALLNVVPPAERLVTVEDAVELAVGHAGRHPRALELECREDNVEGEGEVAMRELTRLALRLSPDRVIVGEARGPEILEMFQAMCQGKDGSMGTLHARSSADAFVQIMRYALKAPERLDPQAVAVDVAASLNLVVHIAKLRSGGRAVTSVREVVGYDGPHVVSNEILAPDRSGRAVPTGTPLRESTLDDLIDAGFDPATLDLPGGGWDG